MGKRWRTFMPLPQSMELVSIFMFESTLYTEWVNDWTIRCSVYWPLRSIYIPWLSNTIPWSASRSRESDTKNFKSGSWIPEEVVRYCVLQLEYGHEYVSHLALYFVPRENRQLKVRKTDLIWLVILFSLMMLGIACHRTLIGWMSRSMSPLRYTDTGATDDTSHI